MARLNTYVRRRRIIFGVLLLTTFTIAWLLHNWNVADRLTVCLFRTLSGRPCPFCGLTRAFAHAMHGDFVEASRSHPLWGFGVFAVIAFAAACLFDGLVGADVTNRLNRFFHRRRLIVVSVLAIFGVWRIVC